MATAGWDNEHDDARRVGRPTSFNTEVSVTIIAALRAGNYLETAAALAGISVATLRNWVRAGKRGTTPAMVEFYERVQQARGAAEAEALERIRRDPSWQSDAWYLERSRPKRWARRKVEPKQPPESPPKPLSEVVAEIRQVLGQNGA